MCLACFQMACTGATGCDAAGFGGLAAPPGAEVRDFTALLAYEEYGSARWNAMLPMVGAQVFVTYSFTEAGAIPSVQDYSPYDATGYWSFDATQRQSTRAALAEVSRVSGVIFVETTGEEAMLQMFGASGSSWGGWANYPNVFQDVTDTGRLVIDMDGTFAPGTSAYQVILHELGHAMGLKHPFDGETVLADDLDNTSQTLMSYTWSGGARSAFSPLDVQALQHLYGTARVNDGWTWAMDGAVFTLTAGIGADVIIGVRSANLLRGGRGADQVIGRSMDDTLYGGSGSDVLAGGDGADRVLGGTGKDSLTGGDGTDRLLAGDGNDQAEGGWGDDLIFGDAGNDRLFGDLADGSGWGRDRLYGGDGDDTLNGGEDADRLSGDAGNDRISGDDGADTLTGGDGDDTLTGGDWGHKTISGGAGNDLILGQSETASFSGWDTITGGSGDDRIFGMAGSDSVDAGSGSDTVYGGAGWDTLLGGSGHDRLFGDADNDMLHGDTGDDTLEGGDGRDALTGGDGHDRLSGGAGVDTLTGGAGRDRLTGGADADYFVFTLADAGWTDLILDFQVDIDRIDLRNQGILRSTLSIADHANGSDAVLTAGDGGVLAIQIAGVRAAGFDLWDVWT